MEYTIFINDYKITIIEVRSITNDFIHYRTSFTHLMGDHYNPNDQMYDKFITLYTFSLEESIKKVKLIQEKIKTFIDCDNYLKFYL